MTSCICFRQFQIYYIYWLIYRSNLKQMLYVSNAIRPHFLHGLNMVFLLFLGAFGAEVGRMGIEGGTFFKYFLRNALFYSRKIS